ncbi:hypothetical protein LP419_39725 [Massilia sp. H-1]|nr:hypothetical protein LP419_39725 [Massilia sp. H-1]
MVRGANPANPMRIAMSDTSKLFVDAAGNIDIKQVNGNLVIDGVNHAISSLYVASVNTPGVAEIEVTLGDMTVESVNAGLGASLIAQGSIIDAFDDAGGPIVNVDTGDLYLQAGFRIGSASNFFDVLVGGDLSGIAGDDVFINSPATLDITTFVSTMRDITLTVDGDTNIGLLQAHAGVVKITSEGDIVDRYNEAAADIESVSVDLESVLGTIGDSLNPFDIDTSFGGIVGSVNALALGTVYLIETHAASCGSTKSAAKPRT